MHSVALAALARDALLADDNLSSERIALYYFYITIFPTTLIINDLLGVGLYGLLRCRLSLGTYHNKYQVRKVEYQRYENGYHCIDCHFAILSSAVFHILGIVWICSK